MRGTTGGVGLLPFSAGDDDAPLSLSLPTAEMEMKPPNEEDDDYDEIAARLKHRAATAYTEEQMCNIK